MTTDTPTNVEAPAVGAAGAAPVAPVAPPHHQRRYDIGLRPRRIVKWIGIAVLALSLQRLVITLAYSYKTTQTIDAPADVAATYPEGCRHVYVSRTWNELIVTDRHVHHFAIVGSDSEHGVTIPIDAYWQLQKGNPQIAALFLPEGVQIDLPPMVPDGSTISYFVPLDWCAPIR
jgi:hypothetical protein